MSSTLEEDQELGTPLGGPVGIQESPPGAPWPGFQSPPGSGAGGPASGAAGTPPPPPPTVTITSTGDEPGDPGLGDGWDGERSPRRVRLGAARTLEPFFTEAIESAGMAANANAQKRDGHPDQWLADDNDKSLAAPLARIVERLLPVTNAMGEPNLRDAIEAGLILARYLMKQANLMSSWRRQRPREMAA